MISIFFLLVILSVLGKSFQLSNAQTCAEDDVQCKINAGIIPKGANPDGKPRAAERECKDRYPQCVDYEQNGECHKNPGWMIMNCPASCKSCDLRDPKLRCPRNALNISTEPIYYPGDMNAMFENIEIEFGNDYDIKVLLRVRHYYIMEIIKAF